MMIFFFDTETTGFVRSDLSFDDDRQPRLVQIAGLLTDDTGEMQSQFSFVVDPKVEIPEAASSVHGITNEKALAVGIPELSALRLFNAMVRFSDLVVAHNIKFDRDVMRCLHSREAAGMGAPQYHTFCTMEEASPIVNLPPTERMVAAGIDKPKPPKLSEAIKFFFNEELEGAHDALVDVVACKRIFFHLKELEMEAP